MRWSSWVISSDMGKVLLHVCTDYLDKYIYMLYLLVAHNLQEDRYVN